MIKSHTVYVHICHDEYYHMHFNAPIEYTRLFVEFKATGTYYRYEYSSGTLIKKGIYLEIYHP